MIKHKIVDNVCVQCFQTVEDILIKLVDNGNKEAGRFAFSVANSQYAQMNSLINFVSNFQCLTEEEELVMNIIL